LRAALGCGPVSHLSRQHRLIKPTFTRARAPLLQRLLLRVPPLVYYGPVAELLRQRCVLKLTTIGRKSGRARTVCVSFMPHGAGFIAFSGWGISSSWYQNVLANPEVEIQVGPRRTRATAKLIAEPEQRRQLMLQMQQQSRRCGPPKPTRGILKALRLFDYEGEIRMAVAQGGDLPVVEITPHG
jgi:deazaflavin-dependent oxidoreductase (nitroreductase family)